MRNGHESADLHYDLGEELIATAGELVENYPRDPAALMRAQAMSSVAQAHFHAALAATTMRTQRDLLGLAAGDVQSAVGDATDDPRPNPSDGGAA